MPTILEINVATGESIIRELTAEEIAELEANKLVEEVPSNVVGNNPDVQHTP